DNTNALAAVGVGKLALERAADPGKLRLGLADRDARFQSRAHQQPHALAARQDRWRPPRRELAHHRQRNPDIGREDRRAVEAWWCDADDGEWSAVQVQRSAEHGWIAAKSAQPELMTEKGDRRRTGAFPVLGPEEPAEMRTSAQHAEVIGRDHVAEYAL